MTAEQIRDVIQGVYGRVLYANGGRYPFDMPAGVTAMAWEEKLSLPDEGVTEYLEAKAEGLAMVGLYYGCDTFARIRVVDRAPASVKSGGGAVMRRPRALIAKAIGWRSN